MPDIPLAIEDRIIGAQIDVLRVEAGLRPELNRLLAAIEQSVAETLRVNDPTAVVRAAYQRERMNRAIAEATAQITQGYDEIAKTLRGDLRDVMRLSAEHTAAAVNDVLKVDIAQARLPADAAARLTDDLLIEGAPSADWWRQQGQATAYRFAQEVRKGMLANESIDAMVRRITGYQPRGRPYVPGLFDYTRRQAQALVRTSVVAAANEARMQTYREHPALVRGFQWIATLDGSTCNACAVLDGKAWNLDFKPLGHSYPYPGPTHHWGCRCTVIPLLTDWESILKGHRKVAAILSEMNPDRGTRASAGGQVPASQTYPQWFAKQRAAVQQEILGPGRYALWASGKLDFTDMVDQSGRPLTLAELRARIGMLQQRSAGMAERTSTAPALAALDPDAAPFQHGVDWVFEHSAGRTPTEYAYMAKEDGTRLFRGRGGAHEYVFSPQEVALLEQAPRAVGVHNHHNDSAPSRADLSSALHFDQSREIVVGNGGSLYVLTFPEGTSRRDALLARDRGDRLVDGAIPKGVSGITDITDELYAGAYHLVDAAAADVAGYDYAFRLSPGMQANVDRAQSVLARGLGVPDNYTAVQRVLRRGMLSDL